ERLRKLDVRGGQLVVQDRPQCHRPAEAADVLRPAITRPARFVQQRQQIPIVLDSTLDPAPGAVPPRFEQLDVVSQPRGKSGRVLRELRRHVAQLLFSNNCTAASNSTIASIAVGNPAYT